MLVLHDHNKAVYTMERVRQLESTEASSMVVISQLASAPLPWAQWLSGKSVRLVTRRSRVQFPAGSLWFPPPVFDCLQYGGRSDAADHVVRNLRPSSFVLQTTSDNKLVKRAMTIEQPPQPS